MIYHLEQITGRSLDDCGADYCKTVGSDLESGSSVVFALLVLRSDNRYTERKQLIVSKKNL